jgi:uncharacterized protein (DUF952 family)
MDQVLLFATNADLALTLALLVNLNAPTVVMVIPHLLAPLPVPNVLLVPTLPV